MTKRPVHRGKAAVLELIERFAALPNGGEFQVFGALRNRDDAPAVIVEIGDFSAVFTPDEARRFADTLDAFVAFVGKRPCRQPWGDLARPLRMAADAIQPRHSVH